jgi:hypothetical protein
MAWLSFYGITRHVILEFFLMSYMGIRMLPKRLFLKRSWIIFTWRSLMWTKFHCSPKINEITLKFKRVFPMVEFLLPLEDFGILIIQD